MGRVMVVLWVLLACVVVAMGYVRLAPSDPVRWHVMPETIADRDFASGAMRVVETGPDGLERLDVVAQSTPRTSVVSGSVDTGMITYVTRTAVMGFPDYTTVMQQGDSLVLYARLRFGRSDFGVNRARIEQWIDAL